MKISIENIEYEVLFKFKVYWLAWDADSDGFIVNKDGIPSLALSNHGHYYFASSIILESKISEYQDAINDSCIALEMLNKK